MLSLANMMETKRIFKQSCFPINIILFWLLCWLCRGESLDNLDMTANRSSWRSSWTPGTTSSIPDYSRPYSSLSGSSSIQSGRPGAATLPSYQSMGSQRPTLPQSISTTSTNSENQPSSQNRYFVYIVLKVRCSETL